MNRAQKALATVLAAVTLATGASGTPRTTETSPLECTLIGFDRGSGVRAPIRIEDIVESQTNADGSETYAITKPIVHETHTRITGGIDNGYFLDDMCRETAFYRTTVDELKEAGWKRYGNAELFGIGHDAYSAIADALDGASPSVHIHATDSVQNTWTEIGDTMYDTERIASTKDVRATGAIDARNAQINIYHSVIEGHEVFQTQISNAHVYSQENASSSERK